MGLIRRRSGENGTERWTGVEPKVYRALGGPLGRKHIVIGPDDGATNVALRVFQIPPGKHSREEEHPSDHCVYIVQGRCRVLLGSETHEVEAGDVIWVKPNEHHRFDNAGPDTLVFLCAVPGWGENDAQQRLPAPAQ
ncbi:MAG: cupin domain-containing protein [Chloroflexota bacterium]